MSWIELSVVRQKRHNFEIFAQELKRHEEYMISIRQAVESDVEALCSLDQIADQESEHREFIRREVARGTYYVAVAGEEIIGYGVMNYNFYHNGWIELLYVHSEHRGRGVGRGLLEHMESLCLTPKLFTSTNLSNLRMQSLLAKTGYELSGVIHNLDEGDPELVYVKKNVMSDE